jgi:tripartite-type tricarboxylate transporter receptor subunit TctC
MLRSVLAAAACALVAHSAVAQSYPSKPVRIVVPFPAGGTTDIVARLVGSELQKMWGQPVVIENRGGAGGNIGTDVVAKSPADGYTLLMGTVGTHAINLPDVPTMEEAAGLAGFDATSWFGLFAPAGTPREIIAKAQQDVAKVLSAPEVRERFIGQGAQPVGNTPEQFAAFIRSEIDKWTQVVKFSGAKVD